MNIKLYYPVLLQETPNVQLYIPAVFQETGNVKQIYPNVVQNIVNNHLIVVNKKLVHPGILF